MMAKNVKPVPEGYNTLTPHLVVQGAAKAAAFYTNAFGAKEIARHTTPDGKMVAHLEMKIGNSVFFMADDFEGKPRSGSSPVILHLYLEDVDKVFKQAVNAGAEVVMPLEDAFWGDRYGQVKDPFGQTWSLATHIKDVTPEEIQKGAIDCFSK